MPRLHPGRLISQVWVEPGHMDVYDWLRSPAIKQGEEMLGTGALLLLPDKPQSQHRAPGRLYQL